MDPQALDEMTASVGHVGILVPILCRQDLNPVEEAEALARVAKRSKKTGMKMIGTVVKLLMLS